MVEPSGGHVDVELHNAGPIKIILYIKLRLTYI